MDNGSIDINATIKEAEALLESDQSASPALRAITKMLLVIIKVLMNQLSLNSQNSSKPPSSDGLKKPPVDKKPASDKKPGGQKGHKGSTLKPFDQPDRIKILKVDRRTLPKGHYQEVGFEKRQVVDIQINRVITEYQAQILVDEKGQRHVAPFPKDVTRPVQYGASVKIHAIGLSQWQLIPFARIQEQFSQSYGIPISTGSLYTFNQEAYKRLASFEQVAKRHLADTAVVHADETGIRVNGKLHWLHSVSNEQWSLFEPHAKRGSEATEDMGVLPNFNGVLCHDHWRPYYGYGCDHALCNAHHLRELKRAHEQDGYAWAQTMHQLLLDLNQAVNDAGGVLSTAEQTAWTRRYRQCLVDAAITCAPPEPSKKRGRTKRSKARNLLERLRDHEKDVLLFMRRKDVPFTNNQAERDIRMTKVQQKISGCFRSMEGAQAFCRIRGYLSTCKKHGMGSTEALMLLFDGKMPDFIQYEIDQINLGAE